jgi:hypothetical protein
MFNAEPLRTLDVLSKFLGLREFNWQSKIGTAVNTSFADVVRNDPIAFFAHNN